MLGLRHAGAIALLRQADAADRHPFLVGIIRENNQQVMLRSKYCGGMLSSCDTDLVSFRNHRAITCRLSPGATLLSILSDA
jgi:hypothetical protein